MKLKNITKRWLTAILILCMVLGSSIAAQAKSIGGSIDVSIRNIEYLITINYVDDEGTEMQAPGYDILLGAGSTYTTTGPAINNYTYVGYYIDGDGDLDNLSQGTPSVTSKQDASDSTNGYGSYTVYIVYNVDDNGNDIPDKDENYKITEKFVDTTGQTLRNDHTVFVNNGIVYNGSVTNIPGYTYVGYYYSAAHMSHTGGSLASPLTGTPYILMNSITGEGTYITTLVYQYDNQQWAEITFNKNHSDATGTMNNQTALIGSTTSLNANQYTRPGYEFKGWSTTSGGTVVYANQAAITPTGDMTLYAVWEIDNSKWGTVTYHSNDGAYANSATGTMANQTVLIGNTVKLNTNQYRLLDEDNDYYVFLGWATTPGSTTVVYTDKQEFIVSGDLDLYAVWGTPDLYISHSVDKSNAVLGDVISYRIVLGNTLSATSTPWYNAVLEITFNEYVSYSNNSAVLTLNGETILAATSFDPSTNKLTVYLGTMNPGDEYVITFNGVAVLPTTKVSLTYEASGSTT